MSRAREVWILLFPGCQSLDVTGPLEVLAGAGEAAAHLGRPGSYDITLLAPQAGPVRTSSGLELVAERGFGGLRGEVDTLIVAGGAGTRRAAQDPATLRFVKRAAARARRVASVCTGAFVLAAAGLLDGKRATTHWAYCAQMQAMFPKIAVDEDPIFVRDGNVYSSAGVTAGMDLALAFVEDDLGVDVARLVARHLVMFLQRPGGQSQFSAQLSTQASSHEPLRETQRYVLEHPARDLSVLALAKRVGMSPRNFARVFVRELGVTPAAFVEQARVHTARRLLEQSSLQIPAIAQRAGFGSVETLRRAFTRTLGVAPTDYRERFRVHTR